MEQEKTPAQAEKAPRRPVKKREQPQRRDRVVIQYGGGEWDAGALLDQAVQDYRAAGHRTSGIRALTVYVKPEEGRVYYVVNDRDTGAVTI